MRDKGEVDPPHNDNGRRRSTKKEASSEATESEATESEEDVAGMVSPSEELQGVRHRERRLGSDHGRPDNDKGDNKRRGEEGGASASVKRRGRADDGRGKNTTRDRVSLDASSSIDRAEGSIVAASEAGATGGGGAQVSRVNDEDGRGGLHGAKKKRGSVDGVTAVLGSREISGGGNRTGKGAAWNVGDLQVNRQAFVGRWDWFDKAFHHSSDTECHL